MLQLSPDDSFHYELLRNLSHARYGGADIGEILEAAGKIEPGNFESFYTAFYDLAMRVNGQAENVDATKFPVSARDAFFRTATYFRAAEFYLHGNQEDPRIASVFEQATKAFDNGIALLPIPGERHTLKGDGFDIPVTYYRVAESGHKKPTLILGNGYDGAQEEMLHVCGFAALERGYNVITYEGPGQPTVRRAQDLGFITEWEKIVTPVVDFLLNRPEVDGGKIGLFGYSMGGFLCLRAAAFEHRLAAVIAVDGVYDVHKAYVNNLPPPLQKSYNANNAADFDKKIADVLASGKAPTSMRWGVEHGCWAFKETSPMEYLKKTKSMTLEGIGNRIQCPAWIGDAAEDLFFLGQAEQAKQTIGDTATYRKFTSVDGASNHCHVGATAYLNQVVFDWFHDVTSKN